jgi:P-type Ca2+ transporter type 2C
MMREIIWHSKPLKEVYKNLESDEKGLSSREAEKRISVYGTNEIHLERKISILKILISQFTDLLVILLLIAAGVSYILSLYGGDTLLDSILIMVIVIANGVFGFVQDYKAEKSIEKLKKMNVKKAKILRDGQVNQILAKNIVPGDIIFLEEGDMVPAGARIISCKNLKVDESILTGESTGVSKENSILKEDAQLADRINMLYTNTTVSRGKATAIVVATGLKTEVGKIAEEIYKAEEKPTPFQIELDHLGKRIGYGILGIIILIAIVQVAIHSSDILTIFLTSIALAVAAIPEGLPAVVTLSLALGTQKMAKNNALVRKLGVVESLGSVDVICSDKTGTLTENMMTVRKVYFDNKIYEVTGTGYDPNGKFIYNGEETNPAVLKKILTAGSLCNDAVFGKDEDGNEKYIGDPTEIALIISAKKGGVEEKYDRIDEIPFSSEAKKMTTFHKIGNRNVAYMKGAPEVLLKMCTKIYEKGKVKKLTPKRRNELMKMNENFAKEALRVLAFAYKESVTINEKDMIFLGLQGMMDPPRKDVKEAIELSRKAGIRTVMITGDNKVTAQQVAKEIGLGSEALEGKDIEKMSDEKLREVVKKVDIFSRVSPTHKVRILKALQSNNRIVSMTGDGVNDAPALKNADVGVAMGIRGTDIAKETSDMILLDDNYSTIVKAIREGRIIFDNIRKFVNYLLSSNFAEVFVIFILSLLGYLPLTAVQLLWINLLTDGFPALALGADPGSPNIMERKPRKKGEGVITKQIFYNIISVGTILTAILISIYLITLPKGLETANTVVFTGFVVYEMIRIYSIRYQEKLTMFSNKWLVIAMSLAILLQIGLIYSPFAHLFDSVPLDTESWILIITGGVAAFILSIAASRKKIE